MAFFDLSHPLLKSRREEEETGRRKELVTFTAKYGRICQLYFIQDGLYFSSDKDHYKNVDAYKGIK